MAGSRIDWGSVLLRVCGAAIVVVLFFWGTLAVLDMYSPLLQQPVSYSVTVSNKPEVCAAGTSQIVFEGNVCSVSGSTLSVLWQSLANVATDDPVCGSGKSIKWNRSEHDRAWAQRFVGFCGLRPIYFERMLNTFDYTQLKFLRRAGVR